MNKKRTYIALVLLLALGVCLWLFLPFADFPLDTALTDTSSNKVSGDSPNVEAMQELIKESKDDPEKSEGLFEALLALLPTKQSHQYRLGFSELEDISFHGKIIDQYGEPVIGATLEWEGGGKLLTPGAGKARNVTDAEGKFSVHVKGGSLTIRNIVHPNIEFLFPNHVQSYGSGGHIVFWGFQRMQGGNEPLWTDYPEDNPYIFHAWRVDPAELVTNLTSGRSNFPVDCEGNTYTYNLLTHTHDKKRIIKGSGEGQLRVRLFCEQDEPRQVAEIWSAELEVIDGGLVETDDLYMFEAPESGYMPSYRMGNQEEGSTYSQSGGKKFYFTSNNGREYGSLIISFTPLPSRPIVTIQYNINPNGGRSLLGPDRGY